MPDLSVIETDTGHYYEFEGQPVPGVTEVLEAADVILKNAFYEERRQVAAIRGKDVHLACADLDRSMPDWWTGSELEPYVAAYARFKKEFHFKPTAIEHPMFHEIFRFAGTPDRFGQIRTDIDEVVNVTLDLKATSTIGAHVDLQLGGYNLFCEDSEFRSMLALQLKPNGKYNIHWVKDPRGSERVFLSMLTVYNWKRRYVK
jgi:hypothetical protein